MISKIEAVNYRCLRNVSQSLGSFHLIAGPNGSGKTTFLEVPYVLGLFARDGLDAVWEATRAKAFDEMTFCGQGKSFQLAVETGIPSQFAGRFGNGGSNAGYTHLRYEIELGLGEDSADGDAPRILIENLWLTPLLASHTRHDLVQKELEFPSSSRTDGDLIRKKSPTGWRKVASKTLKGNSYFKSETTDWNLQIRNPAGKSALSTLPEDDRFDVANWFKSELAERVQKIALRSEHMQSPSSPLKSKLFAVDGSNLPQVVRELRKDAASYAGWLAHLKTILPIKEVAVIERPDDRQLYLEVTFENGSKVKSWHLSDGTLRLLALTLLAYINSNDSIYLIEEPENGIHPQAIEAVFHSLNSVYDGQVLLATHSPVLLAHVKPAELLCFSRGADGATDIIRGDQLAELRRWKGEIKLSQLYAAGILS